VRWAQWAVHIVFVSNSPAYVLPSIGKIGWYLTKLSVTNIKGWHFFWDTVYNSGSALYWGLFMFLYSCLKDTIIELVLFCDVCVLLCSFHSFCSFLLSVYAQSPLHTFPRNFTVYGEVVHLLATSCCNGIWEMTQHNRHNGLLPAPTCYGFVVYVANLLWACYREVANLLRTCYGETGVMDFGFYSAAFLLAFRLPF